MIHRHRVSSAIGGARSSAPSVQWTRARWAVSTMSKSRIAVVRHVALVASASLAALCLTLYGFTTLSESIVVAAIAPRPDESPRSTWLRASVMVTCGIVGVAGMTASLMSIGAVTARAAATGSEAALTSVRRWTLPLFGALAGATTLACVMGVRDSLPTLTLGVGAYAMGALTAMREIGHARRLELYERED